MPQPALDFVLWDPESPSHVARLISQRKHCGWHSPKVSSEWRNAQLEGSICIYWLALSKDEPRMEEYNKRHREYYPDECDTLFDTSNVLFGEQLRPSHMAFFPVGHIAFHKDHPSVSTDAVELPSDRYFWLKSLYVSHALQGLGIGSSAVDHAEVVSFSQPLNARHLLIDAVPKEEQLNEEIAMAYYGQVPKFSNQDWYTRKGYRCIGFLPDFYYEPDKSGKFVSLSAVVMRKDLSPRG